MNQTNLFNFNRALKTTFKQSKKQNIFLQKDSSRFKILNTQNYVEKTIYFLYR